MAAANHRAEEIGGRLHDRWRRLQEEEPALRAWTFRLNRRCKGRLGQCRFDRSEIEVSEWVLSNPELATDTLLHEAAHALAGPRARHGPRWKAVARRLGAEPRSCTTLAQLRTLEVPHHKWLLRCGACEATFLRHRRDRRLSGRHCACGRGRYAYHANPRSSHARSP